MISDSFSDPKQLYQRLTESVKPVTRAFQVTTTYSASMPRLNDPTHPSNSSVPGHEDELLCIPLPLFQKGRLHDDFVVTVNGAEVAAISFDRGIGVILATLRALALSSILENGAAVERVQRLDQYKKLETRFGKLIVSRRSVDTQDEAEKLKDVAEELGTEIEACVGDKLSASLMLDIITALIGHYVVLVPISPETQKSCVLVRMTTSERVILRLDKSPTAFHDRAVKPASRLQQLHSWLAQKYVDLGRFYGVRPARILYPVDKSLRASSYHLEIMGHEGTYLARQRLDLGSARAYYTRLRPRRGQRYLHFYARGVQQQATSTSDPVPLVVAQFAERTPGSIGPATISAAAALLIILVASRLSTATDARSDVVALLLAAPGAVVAWSGLDAGASRVGAAIVSRLSASVTLGLCAFSAFQYLVGTPERYIIPFPAETTWAILTTIALLNVAFITWGCVNRATKYGYFLRKVALDD